MLHLSFEQARECIFRAYEHRGYSGGEALIKMLCKIELINLVDRSKLQGMLVALEQGEAKRKRQKNLGNKIRKNLK